MVENAHKKNDVETFPQPRHVVDRHIAELNRHATYLGGERRLAQIAWVAIDTDDAVGATPLHLEGVEARIAADVEGGHPCQVGWNGIGEAAPFEVRIVAEEMVGSGSDAVELEVVEPWRERLDPVTKVLRRPCQPHRAS